MPSQIRRSPSTTRERIVAPPLPSRRPRPGAVSTDNGHRPVRNPRPGATISDALAREAAPAVRLRADFHPTGVLARTDKSTLVRGRCGGEPVVAKILTDLSPLWAGKFAQERDAYQALSHARPPVRVPRLFAADATVLIIEYVEGRHPVPDRVRYPTHTISTPDLRTITDTLQAVGSWQAPASVCPQTFDYQERLEREHDKGWVSDQHLYALTQLLERAGGERGLAHGDPLLTNFLFDPHGNVTLIDWEHAGRYLPGYDLAVLWTILANAPRARRHIQRRILGQGPRAQAAFEVNRALVLARELRIHSDIPSAPWRDERLTVLARDWADITRTLLG